MEDTAKYWHRDDLLAVVLGALEQAGKDLDRLTAEELAVTDQFHGGGRPATIRLAELARLHAPSVSPRRVLDVGGGLGGPARTLASQFDCEVVAVDITPSYVEVAQRLTAMVGLSEQVTHQVADALDLPFPDESFDVVWTQNSGMNIADKPALYRGFRRMLRPGGLLVFQEPTAGELHPPHYPLMWADDSATSFLFAPGDLHQAVVVAGFEPLEWQFVTETTSSGSAPPPPPHAVQLLVMGADRLAAIQAASRRNVEERRVATVHAVFRAR